MLRNTNGSERREAPRSADPFVVRRRPDTENAHSGANVHHDVRIRISEIERLLFAQLRIVGVVEVVALAPRTVPVDEVNALNQAVQLVELSQVEVYALHADQATGRFLNLFMHENHKI